MAQLEEFDYVVVGAGSAGCVLANRLTADPGCTVLLLEAGGWDRDPWIHIPVGWVRMLVRRQHDWGYDTEPLPELDGRRLECARGRVIGGCSSTNAMAYVRGHAADYDRWAAAGLPGWDYASMLPYFRRQESWEGGASAFRGGDGPLSTRPARYRDPLIEAYAEAALRAGHPTTDDYNGARQEGFGRMQYTIRGGRRCSAAVAYLRPALRRPNLTVRVQALATGIAFEGSRAVGLDYRHQGEARRVRVRREVLLAGGVINSPQLLLLSGIGDPDDLRALDIPLRAALPGVGRNLQDHLAALVAYSRAVPGPFHRAMRADRIAGELIRGGLFGSGAIPDPPGGLTAFLHSQPGAGTGNSPPDMQLLMTAAPFGAAPYLRPFRQPYQDGFAGRVVLLRPESRGRLELASADPTAAPRIRPGFLATERDRRTLRDGMRLFRDLARQPVLQPFIGRELGPGADAVGDADLDAYIRRSAITVHHPLGTCRMGGDDDPLAVLDGALRVRGTEGLRVVDAAAMPDMVGGNINAAVIAIAEKAADLIRAGAQTGRP